MKRAYINFTGPIEVEYELSEMENGDKEENTVQTENNLLIGKIAFIFTSTLVWRKRFFIYLCHLLPFIDQNLIETICKSLNIDVIQTLQIRQLLFSRYLESSDSNTGSREYIAERRNFYHCRVIHLETELFFNRQCFSENEIQELEKSLDYNRLQYMKNVNTLQNRQSRVGYDVISDILGVKRGSVASCIHIVRKKLEEIISVSIHEGSSESIKEMAFCTSTFYPYSVFKVCKNSS